MFSLECVCFSRVPEGEDIWKILAEVRPLGPGETRLWHPSPLWLPGLIQLIGWLGEQSCMPSALMYVIWTKGKIWKGEEILQIIMFYLLTVDIRRARPRTLGSLIQNGPRNQLPLCNHIHCVRQCGLVEIKIWQLDRCGFESQSRSLLGVWPRWQGCCMDCG